MGASKGKSGSTARAGRPERRSKPGNGRTRVVLGIGGAGLILVAVGLMAIPGMLDRGAADHEAPEAAKVLAVQSKMPFQIMIPAYLPPEFDRAHVEVHVQKAGPSGEPMAELTYGTGSEDGPKLYVHEWVPGNPQRETLANSRPIKTKWGKGWLLQQEGLSAVWTDVGPTRTSIYTGDVGKISREQLLAMAESLGPASNRVVFSFVAQPPQIKDMPAPAPYVVPVKNGVQEFTLVITPGGYDPIRVSVKKGVPVKMRFRMLGQVGCGNELIFPADPDNLSALAVKSPSDEKVLTFTPKRTGGFEFYCGHRMFRGLLFVRQ
jgi:hypothetical protein